MHPLASTAWLAERLDDPTLRIADTRWYLGEPDRGREAYAAGHVPGALYVDLESDLTAPDGPGRHPLPSLEDFAASLSRLGIGNDHTVVAYDDRGGAVAARLWWMLRHAGHDRVAVLDGGLTAWHAEGRPVTIEGPRVEADRFVAGPAARRTFDRSGVEASLGDVVLLDARSAVRYRGEEELLDPAAGHIPSARNAPYEGNLGALDRFLPPEELAARYRGLGVTGGRPVVAYCGSGVTACHDLLALEVAGLGGAALYPGSWSDWSSSGGPVATGDEP